LAFVDERVDGLESELGVGAAIEPGFEFHGGHAETEIKTGDGRRDETAEVTGYGVGYCPSAGGGGGAEEK
jgi:hypothetical protein